jgi:hypothetical protein
MEMTLSCLIWNEQLKVFERFSLLCHSQFTINRAHTLKTKKWEKLSTQDKIEMLALDWEHILQRNLAP